MLNSNNLALKYPNTFQEIESGDDFFDELDMQLDLFVLSVLISPDDVDNLFDKIISK
jgi:hypothetical protein